MKLQTKLFLHAFISIFIALLIMTYIIVSMIGMQTTSNEFSGILLKVERLNSALLSYQQSLESFGKNPTEGNLLTSTRKHSDLLDQMKILDDIPLLNDEEKRRISFLRHKIDQIGIDMKVVMEEKKTTEAMQLSSKILGVMNDVYLLNLSLNDLYMLMSKENNKQIVSISIMSGLILLLVSSVFSMIITRRIVKPIKMLSGYAEEIASGNLSIDEIAFTSCDEVGQLTQSFNVMKRNLSELIDRIQKSVDEIKQKNERIHDSIDYAKRIQESILPDDKQLSQTCREHFLVWKPRDTVGGDFYWCKKTENGFYIALGDCTGHGVPGALMTTLSISALDYLVEQRKSSSPAILLKELNQIIKKNLNQETKTGLTDDGLDIGLCYIEDNTITFAGSKIPLYIKTDREFIILKGDRKSIGYRRTPADHLFTDQIITSEESMTFYMTTDGYIDQNGGEKGYSFGKKSWVETIEKAHSFPLYAQKNFFLTELQQYMGEKLQRDDITVLVFKI